MHFKEGTTVYTTDDKKVGDIERFVLDPKAQKIMGLVVRQGFLFKEDRVIPISAVQETKDNRVILNETIQGEEDFPPFRETHYIEPGKPEVDEKFKYELSGPLYYYPPVGAAANWGGVVYARPAIPVEERNIPEGTVSVKENANVISSDGKHVGNVERVIADSDTSQVTHFAVTKGFLFEDEHILPAAWVDIAREDEVRLAVGSNTLEKLGKL